MTQVRWLFAVLVLAFAFCGAARADVYGFVDSATAASPSSTPIGHHPTAATSSTARTRSAIPRSRRPQRPVFRIQAEPLALQQPHPAARNETKVDAALIHAVITVESGYNPSARSRAGAGRLMQAHARHRAALRRHQPA